MNEIIKLPHPFRAVNWNKVEDRMDLAVWNSQWANQWLPEKVPVRKDEQSWSRLTEDQRVLNTRIFTGLNTLDTYQFVKGVPSINRAALSYQEESVNTLIATMEAVHAKSYSYVFMTLCSTQMINAAYEWADNDPYLQRKIQMVRKAYELDDANKSTIASVLLEGFLFYSGFYYPLWLVSRGQMAHTSDLIKLIIRDEALHGYYFGYKFQQRFNLLPSFEQDELREFAYDLLTDLYENECKYTESLYHAVGLSEDVKKFLRYNANKALMNLGFDPLFPEEKTRADQAVLSALEAKITHDFFSGAGSEYKVAVIEPTTDEDWSKLDLSF